MVRSASPRRLHRRGLAAVAAASGLLAASAGVSHAAEATTTNACRSNVTGAYTDIDIKMAGTASGTDTVTLSGTTLSLDFPPDLFISGYNLGLIEPGDEVPGDIDVTVAASGTSEGTFTYPTQSSSAVVNVTDPDGIASTGDETAEAVSLSFSLPDSTWTASGGAISFTQKSAFITATVGGGLIKATFDCVPGVSVDADGLPDNETFETRAASAFATAGQTTATTAPTTATTAPTTATTSGAQVLGSQQTAGAENLATTGAETWVMAAVGIALVNIGYLTWSSTWAPRRVRVSRS